jgi:outer membrane protein OmpA-like peptidoglycan-associated protein
MKKLIIYGTILAVGGCAVDPYTGERVMSKKASMAMVGAVSGAAIGAITGDKEDAKKRALIGAGIGALAGTAVGAYMDNQNEELRRELQGTGVSVQKVGNEIILVMPGNITFETDSSDVNRNFYPVLNSVAKVLKKYKKTLVQVTGHTDSVGAAEYNQRLSVARAQSVAAYLMGQSVESKRFMIQGMGETRPIASNQTAEGRALNRRVEIKLVPITY